MALGILSAAMFLFNGNFDLNAILLGALVIVFFGIIDDIKNLGYVPKFVGQIIASMIVVLSGQVCIKTLGNLAPLGFVIPDWAAIPLSLIVVVGVTNAINLSDGLDGLAGGITMLSFLCMAYVAFTLGQTAIAIVSLAVVGAIFGFLRFNTFPASIFMGDTGSQLLGFLAICFSLKISQDSDTMSRLFPLVLLGFPILDTLTVMTARVARGVSPFKADKSHFHHKLMDLGLSHSEAVFMVYILQSTLVFLSFFFRFYSEWHLLVAYIFFAMTILSGFYIARTTGWSYQHPHIIDFFIKGKIKELRDKQILIKFVFKSFICAFVLLFSVTVFIPDIGIMPPLSILSVCSLILMISGLTTGLWRTQFLKYTFYITTPFFVFFSETSIRICDIPWFSFLFDLLYGVLSLLMITTLKFTRRKKGFKTTPLDFLILFITICLPLLITSQSLGGHMSKIAVKVIVLLFAFEVLAGELRSNTRHLAGITYVMVVSMMIRVVIHTLS